MTFAMPRFLRGFRAILYKEFIVIFRDRTTLFFMFFPPLVEMIAFGYALDTDVKHMALVILNEDRTAESRQFIDRFVNTETFRVVGEVQSIEEMSSQIRRGRAYAGLQIPPKFTEIAIIARGNGSRGRANRRLGLPARHWARGPHSSRIPGNAGRR